MIDPSSHDKKEGEAPVLLPEEMERVGSVLLTARKLLAQGSLLDLEPVGARIALLCERIAALPREERDAALGGAMALMAQLDHLESELKDHLLRAQAQ